MEGKRKNEFWLVFLMVTFFGGEDGDDLIFGVGFEKRSEIRNKNAEKERETKTVVMIAFPPSISVGTDKARRPSNSPSLFPESPSCN